MAKMLNKAVLFVDHFHDKKINILRYEQHYLYSAKDILAFLNKRYTITKKRIMRGMSKNYWVQKQHIDIVNEKNNLDSFHKTDVFFNFQGLLLLLKWCPNDDELLKIVYKINNKYKFISNSFLSEYLYLSK